MRRWIWGVGVLLALGCDDGGPGRSTGATGGQPPAGGTSEQGGAPDTPPPGGQGGQPAPPCPDLDLDGYQDARCNADPLQLGGDCDDLNNAVSPGRQELCAAPLVDNDCDGKLGPQDEDCAQPCEDADGDGYRAARCDADRATGADCNDGDPTVNPGQAEICGNGADDDCQGGDARCEANCTDADGDGFGEGSGCGAYDCDDADRRINPRASEICGDGVDQDCDGVDLRCPEDCADVDRDGFGQGAGCLGPDCNDSDPTVNAGAAEVADDGVDQDCDGEDLRTPADCVDRDGDGYGQGGGCLGPDCDDTDPRAHPGRVEICGNDRDDDCEGGDRTCVRIDPGECIDADRDGFGPGACPRGSLDCADDDPAINPDAEEICDDIDNDCDGRVDECPRANQRCAGGRCRGDSGAPCEQDADCLDELSCNRGTGTCRLAGGAMCGADRDCEPGAGCLVILDCDRDNRRCYQGQDGPCVADCDCRNGLRCHPDNARCGICVDDQDCEAGRRDTCTPSGYCTERVSVGGAGNDARLDFFRRLARCWLDFQGSTSVESCDTILVDRQMEVDGVQVRGFGPQSTAYDNGSPCDDVALRAAGLSLAEVDALDELFGGCSALNLNRINVWWLDEIVPGGVWCTFYSPAKTGFGLPLDARAAVVVDRCDGPVPE